MVLPRILIAKFGLKHNNVGDNQRNRHHHKQLERREGARNHRHFVGWGYRKRHNNCAQRRCTGISQCFAPQRFRRLFAVFCRRLSGILVIVIAAPTKQAACNAYANTEGNAFQCNQTQRGIKRHVRGKPPNQQQTKGGNNKANRQGFGAIAKTAPEASTTLLAKSGRAIDRNQG